LFFKIFIKQCAKQVKQSSIQLNVIKLKTCKFDCIVCAKNVEIFNITLQKINIFLNLVKNLSRFRLNFVQISNLLNFSKLSLFYKNIKINTYNRNYRLALY